MLGIKRIIQHLFLLSLSIGLIACIGDFCQKQTKGFRLYKLFPPLHEKIAEDSNRTVSKDIQAILNQPFTFFKKGQQCFVFLSEDQKYIIKFLRWDKLALSNFEHLLPCYFTKNLEFQRKKKREYDFSSYLIAQQNLFEETGLVYVHLSPNTENTQIITLYDPIGIKHSLPVFSTAFILQKKVEDFYPFLQKKIAEKDYDCLYPFFSSLAILLKNRALQGITDSDISLEYNMGILEGKPILFDIGNLTTDTTCQSLIEQMQQQALIVISSLKELDPCLATFFQAELKRVANEKI